MNVQLQTAKNTSRRRSVSDSPAALPALERRRLQSYLALMCGDIAMLFAAFTFAGWFYLGLAGAESAAELAQLLLPVYLTIALYNGAYSLRALQDASYGGGRSVFALLVSSAVVVFIAFYTKSSQEFSRVVYSLGVIAASGRCSRPNRYPRCRVQLG